MGGKRVEVTWQRGSWEHCPETTAIKEGQKMEHRVNIAK